ncbi:MAG TPA: Sir2 family NAD-dependent protein deacetylase, partial [Negativicutes bacterium]|nr:Sir2 family NAD-dependent protein deacetylase [Negativicutes bacterium]
MDVYEKAAQLIKSSRGTVILTGAGISTDSGIPDFRSPGTGLWEKVDPMEALSAEVLYNDPARFYSMGFNIITSMKDAQPNKAHYLVAELEEKGLVNLVVTQNIDGLHHKAGSRKVYEVHGTTRTCSCEKCGESYKTALIEKRVKAGEVPPRCRCKGLIRPDVVLFGDMLPECFYESINKVENSELLIVMGSSLSVAPVNHLADICRRLMIINIGDTFYDTRCDLKIR